MEFSVGVDVGGGSAKIGLVDSSGAIRLRHWVPTPDTDNPQQAAQAYIRGIRHVLDTLPPVVSTLAGIGIGMPGQISDDRLSANWSNVPVLDDFPLVEFISDHFDLPVRLDNDATVAALAEYHYGAGREAGRMLMVTVGTGVGLGFVVGGHAQRPTRGCMGDPGHIIVDPTGRWQCKLGCRGCLETVATSLSLERDALAEAQWQPPSHLGALLREHRALTAKMIIEAAQGGDAIARNLIEEMGGWLGLAATSWCHIYGPDRILLGGGVSAAGELLLAPIRDTLHKTGMKSYVGDVVVGRAELGNDAGMIGAASLLFFDDMADPGV